MAGNYVLLETIQLTQSAASVTFDNIPQTGYTDLKIETQARSDRSAANSDWTYISFNGVTTGLSAIAIDGDGSGLTSYNTFPRVAGNNSAAGATANTFGSSTCYIPSYRGNTYKSWTAEGAAENNATAAYLTLASGNWASTAAITSITLNPRVGSNYVAGSTFSIYGMAAVDVTPTVAPKATGGNIVANDGTYWYHAFLSSGTFTPQIALTCDYLVVAGGAGGGAGTGGGGGAGGYRTSIGGSALAVTEQSYAITVGAGGAGGAAGGANAGVSGSNSVFSSITSTGGGFGGGHAQSIPAGNGGSGGGAGGGLNPNNTAGIASPAGQGNNGGIAFNGSGAYGAGGGGGAGAVGNNGSSTVGGNGGVGINTNSTWATATLTGVSGYYAGGGGGGTYSGGGGTFNGGTGGTGGGGNAATTSNGTGVSGIASTGGGGGGATYTSNYGAGGAGGSGIVIIRYAMV